MIFKFNYYQKRKLLKIKLPLKGLTSSALSDSTSITSSCQPHKLIILSLNCRSLPPKIDNLRLLAEAQNPHVIALRETWLDNSIKDQEMTIEGNSLVRRDQNRRNCCLPMGERPLHHSLISGTPTIEFETHPTPWNFL